MQKRKQKVFVALSGGVDSSVAAALLKRSGFSVVGVYMKCWTANDPLYKGCTSLDDERSARLAASHLGIPFYAWNFIKEYRKKVVEYMLNGYAKGITPNPDIMCNKEIKFGLFFDKVMKLGADFMATGHYARIRRDCPSSRGGTVPPLHLLEGKDKNKDQSYFLSFIKPEVLSQVLFPIGDYTKPEVRMLAKKFGLPNAERKDSQGICFIGKVNFRDFLKKHISSESGNILDVSGKILGTHEGLPLYTIGQRKGIGLSGGPYYVVRKDFVKNQLIVSNDERDLQTSELLFSNINWFEKPESFPMENIQTRIRYRQPTSKASLVPVEGDKRLYRLVFSEPQRAVTPGQFAVFYQNEELLGGGVIG